MSWIWWILVALGAYVVIGYAYAYFSGSVPAVFSLLPGITSLSQTIGNTVGV